MKARMPLASVGLRVGLMGGSFNPPHEAHLAVAATAIRRLRLDQLWWIVSPGNPLKEKSELAPHGDRIAASRALVRDPRIKVTGFEAQLGSPFSAVTVACAKARYPGVHFVWIMGADNLAGFHRWQSWRRLASLVPIAVVDRPGWRLKAAASPFAHAFAAYRLPEAEAATLALHPPPVWTVLSTRLSGLSSTALRAGGPPP